MTPKTSQGNGFSFYSEIRILGPICQPKSEMQKHTSLESTSAKLMLKITLPCKLSPNLQVSNQDIDYRRDYE